MKKNDNIVYGENIGIATAIEFIENSIKSGKTGFNVNSEFGNIGIELISDMEDEIIVVPWMDAPDTPWAVKYRSNENDFYVAIKPGKTDGMTHIRVIAALSKAMLLTTFKEVDIHDDVIYACVKAYMTEIESATPNINSTCSYYIKEFIEPKYEKAASIRNLVRELMIRQDDAADKILIRSKILLSQAPRTAVSTDPYKKLIAGIMMWMYEYLSMVNSVNVVINSTNIFVNDKFINSEINISPVK